MLINMTEEVKVYEVGGSVRDRLLGIQAKDRDFCVIAPSFDAMRQYILDQGGKIFLEKPEYGVIRCKLEPYGDADFAIGRRDGCYSDGRRPDEISIAASIEEDLARRDFTIGAMAIEKGGVGITQRVIDPFGGVEDVQRCIVRCVGDPEGRFTEDALRIIRAFRFHITKNFSIEKKTEQAMWDCSNLLQNISTERIREELLRCFKHDTTSTVLSLKIYNFILCEMEKRGIWLVPTTKGK